MNNDLISKLRELADLTPPICNYDRPEETEVFGKPITIYCKPFEQFQTLLREAADALSIDAVEVVRCKGCKHFKDWGDGNTICYYWTDDWDAPTEADGFCSYGERREDG